MASSLPTIVLVHGAWHTPPVYQSYIDALKAQSFTVHCPRLPSCSGDSPPTTSLADDAACIRATVAPLVEAGHRVLMLMHSYGGAVGTDAVEGLSLSERKAAGQSGGVVHLVYLAAYILPPGGTVYGIVKEAGVEHLWPVFVDNFEDGLTFPKDAAALFYNGMEKADVDAALPHLVRHPLSTFKEETKGRAWMTVPATYVVTIQDHAAPKIYQDIMLEKVKNAGVKLRVEEYDTCHSVFVTKQKEMVELVLQASKDDRNVK